MKEDLPIKDVVEEDKGKKQVIPIPIPAPAPAPVPFVPIEDQTSLDEGDMPSEVPEHLRGSSAINEYT